MKQLLINRGKPVVIESHIPEVKAHEVLVRVHYSCISSGTEMATISNASQSLASKALGDLKSATEKMIGAVKEHGISATVALIAEKHNQHMAIGYSCSGEVIAVGSKVQRFHVGDLVACAGAGFAHHATHIAVPELLVCKLKDATKIKQASMTTIAAIALQGVRRAQIGLGDKVCVVGLGLLGQLTAQLAVSAGADVTGIDISQSRCLLAKELAGIRVITATDDDLIQDNNYWTHFHGADATLITASSSTPGLIDQAIALTRKRGNIVIVGDVPLTFKREEFYVKEQNLLISSSYGPGRYDYHYELEAKDYPYAFVRWTEQRNLEQCAQMIETGKLNVDALIGKTVALDDAEKIYQDLASSQALSMVISYDAAINKHASAHIKKPLPETLNLAVVGAGGFCKTMLLPQFAQADGANIKMIIDADNAVAQTIAKTYSAHAGKIFDEALVQDNITTVVIATPHASHAEQTLKALQAGKHVFVEKPLAVTQEDFKPLLNYLQNNQDAPLCVDFNRSHAPLITEITKQLQQRTQPMTIMYRMNVGYLPEAHWSQHEHQRGRIIGEGCHIMHLFCHLTNARPRTLSAVAHPATNGMPSTDNTIITVSMSDGSVCTLIYTAQGNKAVEKEYMELHSQGLSFVLHDYKTLHTYSKKEVTKHAHSKGHAELITAACTYFRGKSTQPISLQQIIDATQMSIAADELIRSGGGMIEF